MKKSGIPEFNQHKEGHGCIIKKIEDMDKRIRVVKFVVSVERTSFIKSWLTSHIIDNDKKYRVCLSSEGIF